jgi:flagellar operon protein
MSGGPFLYPNVTSIPSQTGIQPGAGGGKQEQAIKGEFDQAFDRALDLEQVRSPLKFSSHATQRLNERKISMDPVVMAKLNEAVDKAAAKGIEDTLVLTNDAALIVSVKNRTVITAMDRNSLSGNVFTNIDGAVVI